LSGAEFVAKFGAAWIVIGRDGVVVGIVPIAAPFVDVVAHIEEAEGVGSVAGHGVRPGLPAGGVVGERLRRVIAPGKIMLLEVAAGGVLPFGFGGKTKAATGLLGEPAAVAIGVKPGDACDRLLGMIEIFVAPVRWRVRSDGGQKERVFGVGDLSAGKEKSIEPDTVDRALAVLAGGGTHEEPGGGNGDEGGFEGYGLGLSG